MRTVRTIATALPLALAMPAVAADFTSIRFDHTGQFQVWTVPRTGFFSIEAWGASGGAGFFFNPGGPEEIVDSVGGRGIGVIDWAYLNKGQVLTIAVGGAGQGDPTRMSDFGGGGGGGSFVGRVGFNDPVVIAGGGGGGGYQNVSPASGGDAIFGIGPRMGGVCDNGRGQGGAGGILGGGGGGGWCSDGRSGYDLDNLGAIYGEGGGGYLSVRNLEGGAGDVYLGKGFPGGFGGGGGGGPCAGGGGGGYAGGRGGNYGICDGMGGGGGSSFASLNARFLGYAPIYQNGWVIISSVPEPSTWTLLITGFGLTGIVMRRRRSAVAT